MGNNVQTKDARGNVTDMTYDAAKRLLETQQPEVAIYASSPGRPTISNQYDKNGNITLSWLGQTEPRAKLA